MKKILLVAATAGESQPLQSAFLWENEANYQVLVREKTTFYLLHTGIGMVNTAYQLGKFLAQHRIDYAVNFGIAGSFDRNLSLGQVVEIVEDSFSEMGAEDHTHFLDLSVLGFPSLMQPLHYNTFTQPKPSTFSLPKTTAITVNTVHGEANAIEKCQKLWQKQLETMESAAFFQVMIAENIPFVALRAISNYVEPRNRANWQIGLAVKNINEFLQQWIENSEQ